MNDMKAFLLFLSTWLFITLDNVLYTSICMQDSEQVGGLALKPLSQKINPSK